MHLSSVFVILSLLLPIHNGLFVNVDIKKSEQQTVLTFLKCGKKMGEIDLKHERVIFYCEKKITLKTRKVPQ